MDKDFLRSLNDLQYSDKEIEEMERKAFSQEIDMDRFYIKNASLKRKLAIETINESIREELSTGELIEKAVIADSGMLAIGPTIPGPFNWGAPIYFYIILTNIRIVIIGLDFNYKAVTTYIKNIEEILGVSESWEKKKYCEIAFKDSTIMLTSKGDKRELKELIQALRDKNVKEWRYKFKKEWLLLGCGGVLIIIVLLAMFYNMLSLL